MRLCLRAVRRLFPPAAAALLLVRLVAPAMAEAPVPSAPAPPAPEAASGWRATGPKLARRQMVVAANPIAAEAGLAVLRNGGSAVDAAVAVQLVLGLVEPQSSGLGGGAFVLAWDAASGRVSAYDGRETAPAAAKPDRFLVGGRPMPFAAAVKSSLSIGVPGTVRLLEHIHQRHGSLPWSALFEIAIGLAEKGFPVSPRLHALLVAAGPTTFDSEARRLFFDAAGKALSAGRSLANPAYADTLKRLAAGGASAFYAGPVAAAIVAAAAVEPAGAGAITLADLESYRDVEREPVCVPYRGHRVCGMGPPSSGGHTIGQALMLLEPMSLGAGPGAAMSPASLHLMIEALKLAFADRNRYLADPDFAAPPTGLLDPSYLARRRSLIQPLAAMPAPPPGTPPGVDRRAFGPDATAEARGTSHVSIVDAAGNVVAMTTTIESAFGSGRMAAGLLLNNELTDFSFRPDRDGRPIANRLEGGKRPRSSMSPTIVLGADGTPVIVAGSSGGSRIIPYVLKTLVGLIDWRLDAASAVALPNVATRGAAVEMEMPPVTGLAGLGHPAGPLAVVGAALRLRALGHEMHFETMTSGTQVIVRRPDGLLEGAADPRREGRAVGE